MGREAFVDKCEAVTIEIQAKRNDRIQECEQQRTPMTKSEQEKFAEDVRKIKAYQLHIQNLAWSIAIDADDLLEIEEFVWVPPA